MLVFQTTLILVYSPAETRSFLLFAIAFSGAAAVGISYTTAWCIRTTSSTTYRWVTVSYCLGNPPS